MRPAWLVLRPWPLATGSTVAFFALTTLLWIRLDTVPPLWDQAQYLAESELLYHTLLDAGPLAFCSRFAHTLGIKAPLITVLPLPMYALFGESHDSARWVNVVALLVAAWYLLRLGTLLAGRRAALLSLILLSTFPVVAGMSRHFNVEYALMTVTIAWIYYLVRWHGGAERSASWALGVLLGLGMLLKVSFPLYVAAPTLLVLGRDLWRHRRLRPALLASVGRIALVGIPLAATWYSFNWRPITQFALIAGYSEAARPYGRGNVFALGTIGVYWLDLINTGIAAFSALLLLAVLAWLLVGRQAPAARLALAPGAMGLLLSWWLVPWLVLTLAVTKDVRFTVPYLPALALLIGAGCAAITRRRFTVAGPALVAAVALACYLFYSFAPRGRDLRMAGLVLLSRHLGWAAHPPTSERWPNERIWRLVEGDARRRGSEQPRVTLLFSHPALSPHNLTYLSSLHRSSVRFRSWHFGGAEPAERLARDVVATGDYVLTKSGSIGNPALNARNVDVRQALEAMGFPFVPVASLALPDGSDATLFRSAETPPHAVGSRRQPLRPGVVTTAAPGSPPPTALFGDSIGLHDSALSCVPAGCRLRLAWRCVAPVGEDLRVFVHAFDGAGKLHALADYYPAGGIYPTSRWQVGEVIEDEVRIAAPPPTGLRVYAGWYHLATRRQLPMRGKSAPQAGEPNGVLVETSGGPTP